MDYLDDYMTKNIIFYLSIVDQIKVMCCCQRIRNILNDKYFSEREIRRSRVMSGEYIRGVDARSYAVSGRYITPFGTIFEGTPKQLMKACLIAGQYGHKTIYTVIESMTYDYSATLNYCIGIAISGGDMTYHEFIERVCDTIKNKPTEKQFHACTFIGSCAGGHLKKAQNIFDMMIKTNTYDIEYIMKKGLQLACKYDRTQCIDWLISMRKNDYTKIVKYACIGGDLERVKYFINECKGEFNIKRSFYKACAHGNVDICKYFLLEFGKCHITKLITGELFGKIYEKNKYEILKLLSKYIGYIDVVPTIYSRDNPKLLLDVLNIILKSNTTSDDKIRMWITEHNICAAVYNGRLDTLELMLQKCPEKIGIIIQHSIYMEALQINPKLKIMDFIFSLEITKQIKQKYNDNIHIHISKCISLADDGMFLHHACDGVLRRVSRGIMNMSLIKTMKYFDVDYVDILRLCSNVGGNKKIFEYMIDAIPIIRDDSTFSPISNKLRLDELFLSFCENNNIGAVEILILSGKINLGECLIKYWDVIMKKNLVVKLLFRYIEKNEYNKIITMDMINCMLQQSHFPPTVTKIVLKYIKMVIKNE